MGCLTFERPRPLSEEDSVEGFRCGAEVVDAWVAHHALRARALGTAVVYASFCDKRLAGLYSLSSQSISREETSGRIARNALLQLLRSFQACSALTRFCGSVDEVETRSYYSVKSPYILRLF